VIPVTTSGKALDAAISPDGKYIAYVLADGAQESLWMRHITTSSDVQINAPANLSYSGLTFSRSGDYLYYSSWDGITPITLYQMPVFGGTSRRIITDVDSIVTFSPDDKHFAFLRGKPSQNEASLIVANTDGTGERKLTTHHIADLFLSGPNYLGPAWSPNGELIAFGFRDSLAGAGVSKVMAVQVKDGVEKLITSHEWSVFGPICWLHDGNGLVLIAAEGDAGSNKQIWYVSHPDGRVQRITNDLNDYQSVSLSADSTVLVTLQHQRLSNIWTASIEDANSATQISSNKYDGLQGISWTPDDKIVYVSQTSGGSELWIMNADGSNQKQLTSDARVNSPPSVSADGRYVIYSSSRTDISHVWRMDINGGNELQLSRGRANWAPQCTIDQSVVYTSFGPEKRLWKVPIAGGNPVQLTDFDSTLLTISPKDGEIAYVYTSMADQERPVRKIGLIPLEGGPPTQTFELGVRLRTVKWAPQGRMLTYVESRGDVSNIWSQPIDGGPPKQLTNFKSDLIFSYDWSRDGKKLALARGSRIRDVVLIRDITNPQ